MTLYAEMRKNPRVIGVKNSSMPTQDIQMFVADGGDDHIVFNGPDEQFISGRVIGAKAGIGGTLRVMPDLFLKLNELIKESDFETAKELQYAINDVIYKMVSGRANLYAVIKEILRLNEKLDLGSVRAPLNHCMKKILQLQKKQQNLFNKHEKNFYNKIKSIWRYVMGTTGFTIIDLIILIVYLLVVLVAGTISKKRDERERVL